MHHALGHELLAHHDLLRDPRAAVGTTLDDLRAGQAGAAELELVRGSGWVAWPPRLADQPIFYPVLNEDYAVRIARDWNVPQSGVGFVIRFEVDSAF